MDAASASQLKIDMTSKQPETTTLWVKCPIPVKLPESDIKMINLRKSCASAEKMSTDVSLLPVERQCALLELEAIRDALERAVVIQQAPVSCKKLMDIPDTTDAPNVRNAFIVEWHTPWRASAVQRSYLTTRYAMIAQREVKLKEWRWVMLELSSLLIFGGETIDAAPTMTTDSELPLVTLRVISHFPMIVIGKVAPLFVEPMFPPAVLSKPKSPVTTAAAPASK